MKYLVLLTIILFGGYIALSAQDSSAGNPPPPPAMQTSPPITAKEVEGAGNPPPPFNPNFTPTHTDVEVYLSIAILFFGVLVTLGFMWAIINRTKDATSSEFIDAMRYPVVLVIVVGSLFMVTAGYGTDQTAPILGLLGTIAGYLMGRAKPNT